MNEETRDTLHGLFTVIGFIALVLGCVRGCSIMNSPETIRAENEARLKTAEFNSTHPSYK